MSLIALCFAAAGSRVSLRRAVCLHRSRFGGFAGFIGGFLYWSTAACGRVGGDSVCGSVGVLWPPLGSGGLRGLLLVVLFAILAVVNIRGIKPGIIDRDNYGCEAGAPSDAHRHWCWSLNPGFLTASLPTASQVGQVSIILIFAFVGVEVALTPSGKSRFGSHCPSRGSQRSRDCNVDLCGRPDGCAGLLGPELPVYTDAPLAETAGRLLGNGGKLFLLIGGTISIFGYIAGTCSARRGRCSLWRATVRCRKAWHECILVIALRRWRSESMPSSSRCGDLEQLRAARDHGETSSALLCICYVVAAS